MWPAPGVWRQPNKLRLPMKSMALAPVIPRLCSLRLPTASACICMSCVTCLAVARTSFMAVGGLAFVRGQSASATAHCCHASDDKDDSEEAEDHDIEHDLLDHALLRFPTVDAIHPVFRGRLRLLN
jgi:hypothetical protein